jgi:hypothetical protein
MNLYYSWGLPLNFVTELDGRRLLASLDGDRTYLHFDGYASYFEFSMRPSGFRADK